MEFGNVISFLNAKLFDFNNFSSRIYLAREVNQLLKVYGNDCVLFGLKVHQLEINNNIIKLKINPGKAIVDLTLVEFLNMIDLEFDVSKFDLDNFYILVGISFNYLEKGYENNVKIKILFVNKNTNFSPDFQERTDRVFLTRIDVDKRNQKIKYIKESFVRNYKFNLNGKQFRLYPPSELMNCLIQIQKEVLC